MSLASRRPQARRGTPRTPGGSSRERGRTRSTSFAHAQVVRTRPMPPPEALRSVYSTPSADMSCAESFCSPSARWLASLPTSPLSAAGWRLRTTSPSVQASRRGGAPAATRLHAVVLLDVLGSAPDFVRQLERIRPMLDPEGIFAVPTMMAGSRFRFDRMPGSSIAGPYCFTRASLSLSSSTARAFVL